MAFSFSSFCMNKSITNMNNNFETIHQREEVVSLQNNATKCSVKLKNKYEIWTIIASNPLFLFRYFLKKDLD